MDGPMTAKEALAEATRANMKPGDVRYYENEEQRQAIEREALAEATRAKYDKPDVYLGVLARFPRALTEIAKVSRFGSEKHKVPMGDLSFLEVPEAETVYVKAEARHMLAEAVHGSINIEDGGLLHKAQKAWNALADLEVMLSRCNERALKQAILSGDFPPIKM